MAFQGRTQVIPINGGPVPTENYISAAAIAVGDLVTMETSGKVQKASGAGVAYESTGTKLVGVACNAATGANQAVKVELLTAVTALILPSYGAAPSLAILGAPGTKFPLINDSGVFKANLGSASNPVARVVQIEPTDSRASGADVPKASGFVVGDRVVVQVDATQRYWQ